MAKRDRDAARRNTRMRFEQWARNPACEANTFSAVHNVPMASVAQKIGLERTFGQSQFALARGQDFESGLFARNGKRLLDELIAAGVLPAGATGFLDLRLRMNRGTRIGTIDEAIVATDEVLQKIAKGDSNLPALVAGPTVRIPRGVMLPEAILIIDALVVRSDTSPVRVIVGEIKSYPDRGGYTDPGELASARAQAGLYLHALEVVTTGLGIRDRIDLASEGFLVLSRPGSNWPSIRKGEDLRFQAIRAKRGFDLLEQAATVLPELVFDDETQIDEQLVSAVLTSDHRYSEACLSFCDLVPRCRKEAAAQGDAIVLGDEIKRFVGGINLPRVNELLSGAEPRDEAERDFVRRVHDSDGVFVK